MVSSMKIVALFDCMFIFVRIIGGCSDDGDCGSGVCCGTGSWFDGVCLESCFNHFCRTDNECANRKDRLICCGNRCVFGSNCASRSCSMDSDCSANQACCHSKCLQRSSCFGQKCTFDSDCSANQACCNSKCIEGNDCFGQRCNFNSDCSSGQSCCSGNCKDGLTCIGKSCISETNCQATEVCCRGTCSTDCKNVEYIVWPIAAFLAVVFLIIVILLIYRRRQAKRRQPTTRDITSNITAPTDNTGITSSILKENYPLYQTQGPTFDQQFENFSENEQLLQCWSHLNSPAAIVLSWTCWFHISPNVRESRFRNPENFGLWNLESGDIRNTAQGVKNPSSTDKYRNPETQPVLDSPFMGRHIYGADKLTCFLGSRTRFC